MKLFQKKDKDNNYNKYYDSDGYFIEDNRDSFSAKNNIPKTDKDLFILRQKIANSSSEITNEQAEYGSDIYNNDNDNSNGSIDYDYNDYDTNIYSNTEKVNIKIITCVFLYIIFLILGVVSTTFENGYVPQIITAQIKSQRVIYQKTVSIINFLEELDDFKGLQELQDLNETQRYQEQIPPLKHALKNVCKQKEKLQMKMYKTKETDYLKIEMINMVNDLLESEENTLKLAIKYYQSISGYNSKDNANLIEMQNNLLNTHNQYKTKLANYKIRLEQIKQEELLILD